MCLQSRCPERARMKISPSVSDRILPMSSDPKIEFPVNGSAPSRNRRAAGWVTHANERSRLGETWRCLLGLIPDNIASCTAHTPHLTGHSHTISPLALLTSRRLPLESGSSERRSTVLESRYPPSQWSITYITYTIRCLSHPRTKEGQR